MNVNKNIDSNKLIQAVAKRPALYDKENQLYYCHNKFKQRLWKETCEEVYPDWDTMSTFKRIEYGRELQKRWKNLRTCFAREMAVLKKEYNDKLEGRRVKPRKRYEHFNKMSFILSSEEKKNMEDIFKIIGPNRNGVEIDGNEDSGGLMKTEFISTDYDDDNDDDMIGDDDENIVVLENLEPKEPEKNSVDVFQNTEEHVATADNDDKLFLLSLLKTFKKFDDRQRFEAKIQILQTLRKIQFPED